MLTVSSVSSPNLYDMFVLFVSVCAAFRHSCRWFGTTPGAQGGGKWRKEHGLARSGSEYGPLTDLPDWSFADGRAAPPMKGMLRRRGEREEMARRIVMLSSEMDRGIESWLEREEEAQRIEERQKSLLLKPKGKLLKKKDAHS
ncbi:39S ribosomal protein L52, mitochondrial isoform X2 [Syngnathus acus]|uniref:39S ribosomal protein L52, mitochondrial isoform X2 n=1 Tax=Syngnathus acus TaxID=161584 RepID=UPI001885F2E1|nr:39S ribosomal protein L52, mitochondrial isoform X2 [Syngnathus acus]